MTPNLFIFLPSCHAQLCLVNAAIRSKEHLDWKVMQFAMWTKTYGPAAAKLLIKKQNNFFYEHSKQKQDQVETACRKCVLYSSNQ